MNSMRARSAVAALCLPILIAACSGGSSSGSSNTSSENSQSGSLVIKGAFGPLPTPLAAPVPGDGIWNYSVATDYYFGSSGSSVGPSLLADFKANNLAQKITYVFPVFGSLDQGTSKNYFPNSAQLNCYDSNKNPTTQMVFSYYALPQIKPSATTAAEQYLGDCVDGNLVTKYYKNTVGIPRVVPVVEMSAAFNAAIVYQQTASNPWQFGADELVDLANSIAQTILKDPNVYGVAFDNEPAIFKATSTADTPVVNCQGLDLEHLFYGALARALASDTVNGPKYLFLFDAPDTARALYTNASSVSYSDAKGISHTCSYSQTLTPNSFQPLTNIVVKPALYDMATANDSGPLTLTDYQNQASKAVQSALGVPTDPPVMFVLPASATDTLWTNLQTYNLNFKKSPYVPPTQLTKTAACNPDVKTPGTVNYELVTSLICEGDQLGCPGSKLPFNPQTNATSFYNQCLAYQNTYTRPDNKTMLVMNDYFKAALSTLNTTNITPANKARYLGVSLYAWRIPQFSDISGAISYYSIYADKTLWKNTIQTLPVEVSSDVWKSYLGWSSPLALGK